ncbi:MAG: hypothetical protein ABR569_11165 [Gaiellaceae bacterium]
MRRTVILAALAAAIAAPSAQGLPRFGVLVPGRSLAGVRLGDTAAAVKKRLGGFYGICRTCSAPTLYFTYKPFAQQGLAVELRSGRAAAVYTLWEPPLWRSTGGLRLGAPQPTVPGLRTVACRGYRAFVATSPRALTAYYVVEGRLWGFGLVRPTLGVCR